MGTIDRPYTRENRLALQARYKRKQRKSALGVVAGIVTFLVLGTLVVLFLTIGGIEQFVNGVTAHPVNATDIAVGAVRALFTGLGLWAAGSLSLLIGAAVGGEL